jgi:hypothetical protein
MLSRHILFTNQIASIRDLLGKLKRAGNTFACLLRIKKFSLTSSHISFI